MFKLINDICKEYGGVTSDDSEVWMVQFPNQMYADDVVEFINSLAARDGWYSHRHCAIGGLIVIHASK